MIRSLTSADASAFVALRRRALLDAPLAFSASPETDVMSSENAVRDYLGRNALFGAFDGDALVGAVGLMRERHAKAAHKASLWGMFVLPSHRARGLGRALLDAALAHARELGVSAVHLAVTTDDARRLYERAGFRSWGTQPDALRHEGQRVAEHHMVLYV